MTNEELKALCYKIIDLIDYEEHISKLHNCNTCAAKRDCPKAPRLGEWTRINCFAWEPEGEFIE